MLDSNKGVLSNEAFLTDTIQTQSTKAIFWHLLVYILFKNISEIFIFQKKFVDFKNPIVLHNVIFNMKATFEIVVRIVTGFKYFSHY